MRLSQRFACKVVGQPRSTQRKELARNTPDDPDADLRKWVRDWAKANQRKGFRRAWADFRAAGWVINKKKVQRLWREEGLRVKVRKIRKRAGASTTPITEATLRKSYGRIDFQFDSTTDGRKFFGRVDGRRTHPTVRTEHRREIHPGRGSRRRLGEGVRTLGLTTAGVAVRQRARVHLRGTEDVLRGPGRYRICSTWSALVAGEVTIHEIGCGWGLMLGSGTLVSRKSFHTSSSHQ
ncbi:putative transposase (plasmid) [Rhodococcus erythropolis PR4]|uniref:Putative transposase n=1 Tax=Rhodococcus erythropolis (strain PR4 / NBRC 100887) TaxID=234621 RepID=Q3L9H8_RHOE4|nr:putative transposase [Rhodococcus erythropolis PR4]